MQNSNRANRNIGGWRLQIGFDRLVRVHYLLPVPMLTHRHHRHHHHAPSALAGVPV